MFTFFENFLSGQSFLWQKDVGYSNYIGAICPLNNEQLLVVDNRISHSPFNQQTDYHDIIIYNFDFTSGFGDSLLVSDDTCPLLCANVIDIDGQNFVGYGSARNITSNSYDAYLFWFNDDLTFLKDTTLHFDTCDIILQTHFKLFDNNWIISGSWNSHEFPGVSGSCIVLLDETGKVTDVKFIKCNAPPLGFIELPGLAGLHGISANS